jgi:hypothetical protein
MYQMAILRHRAILVPVLVGVSLVAISFALYLSTLAPTLTWGWNDTGVDGGELLAAANTFGIPHPPGYPTYTLLLKTFATLVPLGDFAYRGNLLSSILAAASVFTVYWAALRLCRSIKPDAPWALAVIGAALGGAVFAASPLFWSQAVITEVYALNALFAGALLLLASSMALGQPSRQAVGARSTTMKLALFGFLLGIGLGNHLTLLAVAVPLLYWLWSALGLRRLASPWMIGAFLVGVAVYAYLPIRAAQSPPINWGNTDTLRGAVWMLSARPYQEYLFGVTAGSIPIRLLSWTELAFNQFNPLGLFLGLLAVGPLRSRAPRFFVASLASMALISIYAIMYNSVDFEVLMVPVFLLFSVWVGVGFFWITSTWVRDFASSQRDSPRWGVRVLASHQVLVLSILGFTLLPLTSVILNYGSQNLSGDYRAFDHASGIMNAVPDGSVVLSNREKNVFSLWYMRYVEQPERDVAVIAVPLMQFDWYLRDIHRLFPESIPAMDGMDPLEALGRIVEHNDGRAGVFFTFSNPSLSDAVSLSRVENIVPALYQASVKGER